MSFIEIYGARTHNLKNIRVSIPRDKLTVITGLSGSGKSSLAFDTLFAEGQRRYVESLSAYARQFLSMMEKPDVDRIEGLSPAISIDQKATSHNPRSTVGTVTEIYDYLRLLYARVGTPHCPEHKLPLNAQTISQMVDTILELPENHKFMILAPVVRGRKGEHLDLIASLRKQGFLRARINGNVVELDQPVKLSLHKQHVIEVVIDRLKVHSDQRLRIAESLELAVNLAHGLVTIASLEDTKTPEQTFSARFACSECGFSIPELEPRIFSFNNPAGACPECDGLGFKQFFDPEKIKLNPTFSFSLGKVPTDGMVAYIEKLYHQTSSHSLREELSRYISVRPCSSCQGQRLNPAARNVLIENKSIIDVTTLSITDVQNHFQKLNLPGKKAQIAEKILREVASRLEFLIEVGLHYLTLHRSADTLSGGEAQRIRLASQIGTGLVGVTYILDEPSIGLHQRDNQKLLFTLKRLRDLGNTVVVIEHDEEAILAADHIIDLGPGAGVHGGEVVAEGSPAAILKNPQSLTGQYLSGNQKITIPKNRKKIDSTHLIRVSDAEGNNLKNLTVEIPVGLLTCVTGVSGSGKSTLINETLYPVAVEKLNGANAAQNQAPYREIEGLDHLDKVIEVDQSPLGRTPRSNPATYTGLFTPIRELFANTPESRSRGYKIGRFSFNVKGGRCEACQGEGIVHVEMHFLPDIQVPCDVCHGKRYNRETLDIRYKGKTIWEVLNMTVEEANEFFSAIPTIQRKLSTLIEVGLSYIHLGQSATTLSGGEAQRIKLAKELSKQGTGKTLYILDEPTTGLHFHDIAMLLKVLMRLRDQGNTIVVIEHNLDVIKTADWIIDLGPEGGAGGGQLVATGTPEQVAQHKSSYTGQFLRQVLPNTK